MSAPESSAPSTLAPSAGPAATGAGSGTMARSCSSCGRTLIGWGVVTFACPRCGTAGLGRCAQCRDQSIVYRCRTCDFQGP